MKICERCGEPNWEIEGENPKCIKCEKPLKGEAQCRPMVGGTDMLNTSTGDGYKGLSTYIHLIPQSDERES